MKLLPTYYWYETLPEDNTTIFLFEPMKLEYIFSGHIQRCLSMSQHLDDLSNHRLIRRTK